MSHEVTVIIATYGDPSWIDLARRAAQSAAAQTVLPAIIMVHGETLASARNEGARLAETEWLIFLDGDDELDLGYVEAMLSGEGDVRRPATLGIVNDVEDDAPVMIPRRSLTDCNFLIIGSMVRKEQFDRVGGFEELPALEDWDLWLRCAVDGANITDVPDAIYRVHVRSDSRNQSVKNHGKVYSQIRRKYKGKL